MIPRLDAAALAAGDAASLAALGEAATGVGFATVHNTALSAARVEEAIETYRAFFHLPETEKRAVDMARTGSNRGWGAPGSEQVDPQANPDYKQFFDVGFQLPVGHPLGDKRFYAQNLWPEDPEFKRVISVYYSDALDVARGLLTAIARSIGADAAHFDGAFDTPMALLRGNFYPARPDWAGAKDFGIATHTDYGCLTLLATDGSPGLEVRKRGGGWIPVSAPPGEFIINFGEMLEFWTGGRVKATPHRVVGGVAERISIPMFFNPTYDVNVAPEGSEQVMLAGDHLSARFEETYVHLQDKA
ncbi:isopenicillin N synthase family oxygenase [Tateyamaria omphalii]|uniref:isopenicillin N synthase family dioxygenase n=1 Tax=Tateyamaria omphalii TaxID=299262 RepID=UPI001C99B29F|nr:2-oxoglutarate and iron-dependent oxygenase domain-containing protein [Tateyamaria omphalii]MBY5932889.1 isopenicillin N synthase family oxygenase [Tateyamaria omphalii]